MQPSYKSSLVGHFGSVLERLTEGKRALKAYVRYLQGLGQSEDTIAKHMATLLQRSSNKTFADSLSGPWQLELARLTAARDGSQVRATFLREEAGAMKTLKDDLKKRLEDHQAWYDSHQSSLSGHHTAVEATTKRLNDICSKRDKAVASYIKASSKKQGGLRAGVETAHADACAAYTAYTAAVGTLRTAVIRYIAAAGERLGQLETLDRQRVGAVRDSLRRVTHSTADTTRAMDVPLSRQLSALASPPFADLDVEVANFVKDRLSDPTPTRTFTLVAGTVLTTFPPPAQVDGLPLPAPAPGNIPPAPLLPTLGGGGVGAAMVCPLTGQVMREPVVAADGHTYERAAMESHLLESGISPVTQEKLPSKMLFANNALKQQIDEMLGFQQAEYRPAVNHDDDEDDSPDPTQLSESESESEPESTLAVDSTRPAPLTPQSTHGPYSPDLSMIPSPPTRADVPPTADFGLQGTVQSAMRDLDVMYPTGPGPASPVPETHPRLVRSSSSFSTGAPLRSRTSSFGEGAMPGLGGPTSPARPWASPLGMEAVPPAMGHGSDDEMMETESDFRLPI